MNLILLVSSAQGKSMPYIQEIGEHHRIITFEKNENPQNIMVVYTKVDAQCRFETHDGKPVVDFYWLMDGKRYKPTHPLIKDAVRKRLTITEVKPQEFHLQVNDLSELKAKVDNSNLVVKIEKRSGGCEVASYFPDNQQPGKMIQVTTLFSESKKTLLPPFRKLIAITIRGKLTDSGESVQRRFKSY